MVLGCVLFVMPQFIVLVPKYDLGGIKRRVNFIRGVFFVPVWTRKGPIFQHCDVHVLCERACAHRQLAPLRHACNILRRVFPCESVIAFSME